MEALAILLEAPGLLAVAALVVAPGGVGRSGTNFRAERLWIALERLLDGELALIVILRVVVAALTIVSLSRSESDACSKFNPALQTVA